MTPRAGIVVWTIAVAVASAVAAFVLTADNADNAVWTAALTVPAGLAFTASGVIVRRRRPTEPIGLLLVAIGFGSLLGALKTADDSLLFSAGQALQWTYFGFLVHVVMAFPSSRLPTRLDRVVVGAAYALGFLMLPLVLVFEDEGHEICEEGSCPDNMLAVFPNASVADALERIHLWVALAVVIAVLTRLAVRWQTMGPAARHAATPVYASFTALMVILAAQHIAEATAPSLIDAVNWLLLGALLAMPISLLFGLFRSRFGTAVERLVLELSETRPGGVRDALARALGDPTLELAYATADSGFVGLSGDAVALPRDDPGRRAQLVERDGQTIAALIHDESLTGDPLLETVAAAAGLALENERLHAELRARVADVRASRARLVQAADDARTKLERNLHDGAQQRLVTLALSLRLAEAKLDADPRAAKRMLTEASGDLAQALDELRDLARGLHPAILTDRGLPAALEALAARAPVPVELDAHDNGRLPQPVEIAAYYVVSECLANIGKYANASHARVEVTRRDGNAVVTVSDDGIGGADADGGSGLRGLADRVEALDGRLEVESAPDQGTRISAIIPCEGPTAA